MKKTIRPLRLTAETFAPYGKVVAKRAGAAADNPDFTWTEGLAAFPAGGELSVNVLGCKKRPLIIDRLERHVGTRELIMPLSDQDFILVVAAAGPFDEGTVAAFRLDGTAGVMLGEGVRHYIPYPLTSDGDCLIVFRDGTGANDLTFDALSAPYALEL